MMNYEQFKEAVVEGIKNYLPKEYAKYSVYTHPILKVNQMMDGLNLLPTYDCAIKVAPTIYIRDMYEQYRHSGDLQGVLQDTANTFVRTLEKVTGITPKLEFEKAKDNIVLQLVNTEQNKEMLMDMPNREFLDLSIIYRWLIRKENEAIASIIVNHELANRLNMDEEELYAAAMVNTKRIFPITVKPMVDVLMEVLPSEEFSKEEKEMMSEKAPKKKELYIISNESGINGASSMLYGEVICELAEKIGSDLYLLPSSTHELIAISTIYSDPNELGQMVHEINMSQVALGERLSNQVYKYNKNTGKLCVATSGTNNKLD